MDEHGSFIDDSPIENWDCHSELLPSGKLT